MVEPENLMLEHLRAIRGELTKMGEWMHTMSVEMTAMRQHLAGVVTSRSTTIRIAVLKARLDRVERRSELAD